MAKVEMPDYPDNSQNSKPVPVREDEEHKGVISGKATRKKKGALRRASETMIADDVETIKSYLVFDVLLPAIKDTAFDLVTNGFEMVLFGGSRSSSGRSKGRTRTGHRDYGKYSQNDRKRPQISDRDRKMLIFDDIILDSRGDAERVLDYLRGRIDDYEVATVADFYDAVEVTSNYTDTKYGWYELDDAYVRRVRDGFQVILPKATHLE